eukprot:2098881-Pleurochrysis_carterae.AAC.1
MQFKYSEHHQSFDCFCPILPVPSRIIRIRLSIPSVQASYKDGQLTLSRCSPSFTVSNVAKPSMKDIAAATAILQV